jgi:hypothetical protein
LKAHKSSRLPPPRPTLDTHGANPDFRGRPAPRQDLKYVAYRRAGRTGQQGHAAGKPGRLALALRLEVAEYRQFFFELTKCQFERADPLGLNFLNLQLVLAAGFVDREPAAGYDLHAVAQVEL